jgi:hypothetical protein
MSIYAIKLKDLVNESHFAFHKGVQTKVEKYTAATLGIETLFASYLTQLQREDTALEVIRKSGLTATIEEADHKRDNLFRGLSLAIQSACLHYDAAKQQAGLALQVVMDHYGNVAQKMRDAETGAIMNLASELKDNHAAELIALSLNAWVDELETANEEFKDLRESRDAEGGAKTSLRMAEERPATDDIYRAMVERINALMIVNGEATYGAFVNELNVQIEHYKQIIAQRKGMATAGGSDGETVDGTEVTPPLL